MTRLKRGGRELVVDDSFVTEYLKQGYSVIDDKGNEITRAKAMTYEQAMRELGAANERIRNLSEALHAANAELAAMRQKKAAKREGESPTSPSRIENSQGVAATA